MQCRHRDKDPPANADGRDLATLDGVVRGVPGNAEPCRYLFDLRCRACRRVWERRHSPTGRIDELRRNHYVGVITHSPRRCHDGRRSALLFVYRCFVPNQQQPDDIQVVETSYSFLAGRPVPLPGVRGYVVPQSFSAWIEDTKNAVLVGLHLEVDEGRLGVAELAIKPRSPLTLAEFRKLPYGDYMETATAHVMLRSEHVPASPGTVRLSPLSSVSAARDAASRSRRTQRGPRREVTRERLARVAALYREAIEQGAPSVSAYIAEREYVANGTARALVARAREEGLLGPAKPRQRGEVSQ